MQMPYFGTDVTQLRPLTAYMSKIMGGISTTYHTSCKIVKLKKVMRTADIPEMLCCQEVKQTLQYDSPKYCG